MAFAVSKGISVVTHCYEMNKTISFSYQLTSLDSAWPIFYIRVDSFSQTQFMRMRIDKSYIAASRCPRTDLHGDYCVCVLRTEILNIGTTTLRSQASCPF